MCRLVALVRRDRDFKDLELVVISGRRRQQLTGRSVCGHHGRESDHMIRRGGLWQYQADMLNDKRTSDRVSGRQCTVYRRVSPESFACTNVAMHVSDPRFLQLLNARCHQVGVHARCRRKSGLRASSQCLSLDVAPPWTHEPALDSMPCIQQFIHQCESCCRAIYSSLTSDHAPPELYSLYSVIQRYTAYTACCILYSYTAYTLYSSIQSPSDFCRPSHLPI